MSNQSGDARSSRGQWAIVLAVIFGLACMFRWPGLQRYGFDGDELFSMGIASADWVGLFKAAARDVSHPPLFYALLKIWLMLGPPDEQWTRLLPALLGVGTLVTLNATCAALRIGRVETALVLLLAGINGMLISYSLYLRMFSLLLFTSSLSLYMFVLFAKERVTPVRFAVVVAVNLLLVYAHYWGWLVLFGELVAMVYVHRSKVLGLALAAVCTAVGFAPWAIAVVDVILHRGTAMQQIDWMGAGTPGIVEYSWLFGELNGALSFPHSTVLGMVIYGVPIAVFVVHFLSKKGPPGDRLHSPITWIILTATPALLTSAASLLLRQNLWGERHMIVAATPYYVLLGLSLSQSPMSRRVTAGIGSVIAVWAICAGVAALANTHQRIDWTLIGRSVAADAKPPIAIYASEPFVARPLRFHVGRFLGNNPTILQASDIGKIPSNEFWYVYRDTTWPLPAAPAQIFTHAGFAVERQIATSTKAQTITALLVHKPTVPP